MPVDLFSLFLQQSNVNLRRHDAVVMRLNVHLRWCLNGPQWTDGAVGAAEVQPLKSFQLRFRKLSKVFGLEWIRCRNA